MVLLGAVFILHGAMPFDGDSNSESSECRERHVKLNSGLRDSLSQLYEGTCKASSQMAALDPDLIILVTPHGISLSDSYGIYCNNTAHGTAEWKEHWTEFKVNVKLDVKRSKELKEKFTAKNISAQCIQSYAGVEMRLRWGEVIPIWYLQKYLKKDPPYLIISNDLSSRITELEQFRLEAGRVLSEFVRELQEKVLVVISGDLSHFHPTDCKDPMYLPDPLYGEMPVCPETAPQFDDLIESWVQSGQPIIDPEEPSSVKYAWDPAVALPRLEAAQAIEPLAGACGMKGLVLLHGLLASEKSTGSTLTSEVVVHRVPTYYGMMAATFIKHSTEAV